MKKKTLQIFYSVMLVILIALLSVSNAGALTLYDDGGYTYADLGDGNVALYGWDNSSPTLSVQTFYNNKPVYSIYRYAFQNNQAITTIDFSQALLLREIGNMAFDGCTGLWGSLTLPNTLNTLGIGAFQGCTGLGTVTIANVDVIPQQCFNGDSMLRYVNLPVSLKRIEKLAFANCAIGEIFIPKSVEYIDKSAFNNCRSLSIKCYYGSYAHTYALSNNIPYILLDNALLGDANGDGSVNINDVTVIQRYLAELETLEGIYLHAADANQDGTVDIADATIIQMYLAEYEMEYPIGKVMTQ